MRDETYERLEASITDCLDDAYNYDPGSKERRMIFAEAMALVDRVKDIDRMNLEYYDKEDRRLIDRERNNMSIQIEETKQKIGWKRGLFEILKTMGPIAAYIFAYGKFQGRLFNYESHNGRLTSTAGKELHLPRFSPK